MGRDARHFEPVENRKKPATVEGKSAARITTSDRYNWRYCGNAYPRIQVRCALTQRGSRWLMDAHAPSGIIRPRRVAVPGNRMGKSTCRRNGIHSNEMNESSGMKEREKREDTGQKQTNRTEKDWTKFPVTETSIPVSSSFAVVKLSQTHQEKNRQSTNRKFKDGPGVTRAAATFPRLGKKKKTVQNEKTTAAQVKNRNGQSG
jgi:hypothetical protein